MLHKRTQAIEEKSSGKVIWFSLAFVALSALLLWIFSYNSPLYYFNVSPDDNNFFLVGKMLMHGFLPYKDVFEQKGPFVYLLYGVASLFNGKSLTGMFPLEIIALILIFFGVYRIARLFFGQNGAFAISLFTPLFVFMQPFYDYGGSVEFFTYPMIIWTIYLALKISKNHFAVSPWQWLGEGALVGIVFFSKYTLLGTWIAFYLFVFAVYVYHRNYQSIGKMIIYSGIGFVLTTVPWLIYFQIKNGLNAFFHVYFQINMTLYASTSSFIDKLGTAINFYASFLVRNPFIFVIGVLGILTALFCGKKILTWKQKTLFFWLMIVSGVLTIWGHSISTIYPYYLLVYFPYLLVGGIILMRQLINWIDKVQPVRSSWLDWIIILLISFGGCFLINDNYQASTLFPNNGSVTLHQKGEVSKPAQESFGKIMKENSNGMPTLLVYGRLDNGFYINADAFPTQYYFQKNNIDFRAFPQMMDSQNNVIKKHKDQWIIFRVRDDQNSLKRWLQAEPQNKCRKSLKKNYKMVAHHATMFEGRGVVYYLFERKSDL